MQLPPYPSRHAKNDSYDSQTSLRTLADIASSTRYGDYGALLEDLESMLINFENLHRIINEINNDFHSNLDQSRISSLQQEMFVGDVDLPLKFGYEHQNKTMKLRFFKQFLNNIPLFQLNEAIRLSHEFNQFFQNWLVQREKEASKPDDNDDNVTDDVESKAKSKRQRIKLSKHKKSLSSSSAKKGQLKQINTDQATSKFVGRKRKSEDLRDTPGNTPFAPPTPISSDATKSISKKQHKQLKSSPKPENISLVVKPPKSIVQVPQEGPTISSSQGAFQEDLSLKTDQTCKQCGSDDTPEWRRGPYGTRSLCNACGLFFGKLTKRFGVEEATRIMIQRRDGGNGDDRRIPTGV